MVALTIVHSIALFSSLNNLKHLFLGHSEWTRRLPGRQTFSLFLLTTLCSPGLPASAGPGRAEFSQMIIMALSLGCEEIALWAGSLGMRYSQYLWAVLLHQASIPISRAL